MLWKRFDGNKIAEGWEKPGRTDIENVELYTSFEAKVNSIINFSGALMEGWFKAPETGNYRFYMSCDKNCVLFFNDTHPYNAADPTNEPELSIIAKN